MKTLKAMGLFKYGEIIPNVTIHGVPAPLPCPERASDSSWCWLMFAFGFFAFFQAFYLREFIFIQIFVLA